MAGRGSHIGVDIGGTFTDVVQFDERTKAIHRYKVSSTPPNLATGFLSGVGQALDDIEAPSDVVRVIHATTVATNAIIQGRVAKLALLTTLGFRDLLEIGRQIRPDLYDLFQDKPKPLVPRERCYEVDERMGPNGVPIRPLDESSVVRLIEPLKTASVDAVVICFLHSYLNPAHEQRTREILVEAGLEAFITLSSDVCAEYREFYRASTAVVNAAVQPLVARYLDAVEVGLEKLGVSAPLSIMQSSGGTVRAAEARLQPVRIVESGPAAGVLAAARVAASAGYPNVISFDVGGTTAKAALVQRGHPQVATDFEVGGMAIAGRFGQGKGSGYPIRTPVIDIVEIGAGGGSIAWIDSAGALRVGPESAGAAPGPACYQRGGTEPTVADANLVLGRLDPERFLGGAMTLDVQAAERAIYDRCARPLGLTLHEAAEGIIAIADAAMTNALRLVSVQRGLDPRDFGIVAFGGAGPLHACAQAADLGIPLVIVPPGPGVLSALGLLQADVRRDYSVTRVQPLDELDLGWLEERYGTWKRHALEDLAAEGIQAASVNFVRELDLRYVGQSFELPIKLQDTSLGTHQLQQLAEAFHEAHDRIYGFAAPGEPIEVVNARLTALGTVAQSQLAELAENRSLEEAFCGVRDLYWRGSSQACPVFDRGELGYNGRIAGPALVVEMDSTTFISPEFEAKIDRHGNLLFARR